jgi:holo-[acyl-carrier protein] synthase
MPTFNLRTGVDLVEIPRLAEAIDRHGMRFLERIFTLRELDDVGDNLTSLAARFAAKEAVSKALGTGFGLVGWREVEILRGPTREPILHLHGAAARLAQDKHIKSWSISLSHTQNYAVAFVVAVESRDMGSDA